MQGPVAERSANPESPYVDYLLPNFNRIKDPKVRQALLLATNKKAYQEANGGDKAYADAQSIVNPSLIGYHANPAYGGNPQGDPAAAKALLTEAGVQMPYPLKYTYSGGTPTTDNAAAALKQTWDAAGFNTTLEPLSDTYYDVIQNPAKDSDVYWGGWGADWPSMSTVIPALFDSRINLTPKSNGQDYGNYKSDAVNKLFDEAAAQSDVTAQAAKLVEADTQLGKDVAYIPLGVQKFYFVYGSNITGYVNNPAVSMYPDLGAIGVKS